MAHHKSALKRIKQNERRRMRNKNAKSAVRSSVRKFRETAASGDKAAAEADLRSAVGSLSAAASKGIIPKRRASRLTSRLTKAANRL